MDPIQKKRDDLKGLLKVLADFQEKVGKGTLPDPTEATAMDAKAAEAESLQTEIDTHDRRMKKVRGLVDTGKKIKDPILPEDEGGDDETKGEKGERKRERATKPVGYLRLGDFVVAQEGMKDFQEMGKPRSSFRLAKVKDLFAPVIGLDQKQLDQLKAFDETKAVPTIADSVIDPQNLPDIVRVNELERLSLRDVLDVQRTTSDAVKFTRIVSYTRAAATVARSALKPQAAMVLDTVTEPVRDIAVWIPVEEQQLDDLPALAGMINGELLFDLEKHLEEQIMYGDGEGENFDGIIPNPAVLDCRTEAGDTLIDISRRGITDVRKAGYEPNGILVDPLDWEEIVLEKGTDNRYVWVVVTEGATQRLWGVPVIETIAMEAFNGDDQEERNLLVGDFARGATLWDRRDAAILVGWINDQFVRNQRTILAELRAAFGVKRPGAFRKHQTQAPVGS